MAKQTAERQARRKARRTGDDRQTRRSAEDILEARGKKPEARKYSLYDCMRLGKIANILFVVFIVVSLIYYYSFAKDDHFILPFEFFAYAVETTAFMLFTLGVVWMATLVRARRAMKIMMVLYIATEVVLMLLEFHLLTFIPYNGLSLPLIIVHSIFSAIVSFSLLVLDPQNKKMQWVIGITSTVILAGMLTGIAGYRVYASILINAFAYIFFFSASEHLLRLEEMNVDCYGDPITSTNFDSTMFADTPTMVEREKKTLAQKAKRFAQDLSSEEKLVLTDKDEKFEYEFGVDEVDDDEEEYEDEYEDADSGEGDGEA